MGGELVGSTAWRERWREMQQRMEGEGHGQGEQLLPGPCVDAGLPRCVRWG